MSKRTSGQFERKPRDLYDTVPAAVPPLLPYLAPGTEFIEPCAGNGALIDLLTAAGHVCRWATDIAPGRAGIGKINALWLPGIGAANIPGKVVITNPPWTRSILHPLIDGLSIVWPSWFLFEADWIHTLQSAELYPRCSRIVPVGRLKWMPGTKHVGFDNAAWYEFTPGHTDGPHMMPRAKTGDGRDLLMGRDELRVVQIKATNGTQPPGPLFEPVASHVEPEKLTQPVGPAVERVPDSRDLLARLRKAAGNPGPIPRMTAAVAAGRK